MFIRQSKKILKQREGAIAILSLLGVTVVGLLMMTTLTTLAASEAKLATADIDSTQAFFAAEAGLNVKLYEMASGTTITTPSISGITPAISTSMDGFRSVITSTATDATNKVRKVQLSLVSSSGGFTSAVQAGSGGIIFANSDTTIIGSVYSNGNIQSFTGVGSPANIFGNVTLLNGKSIQGPVNVSGTVNFNDVNNMPSMPIDENNILKWQVDINSYNNPPAPPLVSSSTTLGWQVRNGDLSVTGNGTILTLTGSLWIKGNLTVSNKAKIQISNTFGSNSLLLLVDGLVSIENNTTLSGSGDLSSFLLVISSSDSGATGSGTPAIDVRNNSEATIYAAPFGMLSVKKGNLVAAASKVIRLETQSQVTFNPAASSIFVPSPNSELTVAPSSWREK